MSKFSTRCNCVVCRSYHYGIHSMDILNDASKQSRARVAYRQAQGDMLRMFSYIVMTPLVAIGAIATVQYLMRGF